MSEIKHMKFRNHTNMTGFAGSLEVLVHQKSSHSYTDTQCTGHSGFLFSKMQFLHFCLLRGQVKQQRWCQSWQVQYYIDTVGAWQASVQQKQMKFITKSCSSHTHLILHSKATERLSTGLWCTIWENLSHYHLLLLEGRQFTLTAQLGYIAKIWMTTIMIEIPLWLQN